MSAARKQFRPRPLPTIATALGLAVLLGLGFWQLGRAGFKRDLLHAYDEAGAGSIQFGSRADTRSRPFERVWLEGRFIADRQVFMDGVAHDGRPGYNVLTPLQVSDDDTKIIIVNRGWQPWESDRADPPNPDAPAGPVRVSGLLKAFPRSGIQLGEGNADEPAGWPRVAVYPSADEYSEWLGRPVLDRALLLDPELPFGFVRDWRPDFFPPERHVGYAVQWFSLAVALAVIFVIVSRRPREVRDE